jgi:hypothetical protein
LETDHFLKTFINFRGGDVDVILEKFGNAGGWKVFREREVEGLDFGAYVWRHLLRYIETNEGEKNCFVEVNGTWELTIVIAP